MFTMVKCNRHQSGAENDIEIDIEKVTRKKFDIVILKIIMNIRD